MQNLIFGINVECLIMIVNFGFLDGKIQNRYFCVFDGKIQNKYFWIFGWKNMKIHILESSYKGEGGLETNINYHN